jgi:hypothetical protein
MADEKKFWEVQRGFTYLGKERNSAPRNKKNFKGPGEEFWATEEEVGPERYKLREIRQKPAPSPEPPPKRKPGRPRKVKAENTAILYPPQMTHTPPED